jgi:peptide/nickel transport system substrate-binding protein
LLIGLSGCVRNDVPAALAPSPVTLTLAFGLTSGQNPQFGARQAIFIIAAETLLGSSRDGKPQPRLAESWSLSEDGRILRVRLRDNAKFHRGEPVTADGVREVLTSQLKNNLGPVFQDIEDIRAASPVDLEFQLKRRSRLVLESLADVGILLPGKPGEMLNGTGPFRVTHLSDEGAEMVANDSYYGGRPSIDRIDVKPYASVRAAWADMLRGGADMLYEVGPDAIEILQPSKSVRVINHLRNYGIVGILNVRSPTLRDPRVRRALNSAIDRASLVSDILKGQGVPAVGAVWPSNWAYDATAPVFRYEPRELSGSRIRLKCIVGEVGLERLALALQQQLQRIGVDLEWELLSADTSVARAREGDYDVFLADAQMGPTMQQTYRSWHSQGSRNVGGYSNGKVDAALDRIGAAANDDEYRAGVAALQRAIYEDPPAIFIAWSERARAVSTRFDVPVEPGRDILATLRLWKPATAEMLASRN